MKYEDIEDLNKAYQEADSSLTSHMAEIRSNILLDIGYHHPRFDRFANSRSPVFRDKSRNSVIRITKNHIQYITKFIRNSIQNRAPGGAILPRNKKELSDCKSAELNSSVWEWHKDQSSFSDVISRLIHNYVVAGETYIKTFWDPNQGKVIGYKVRTTTDNKTGEEETEEIPIREGRLVHEVIPPYNMLTDPDANSKQEIKHYIILKQIPRKTLLSDHAGDSEAEEIIKKASTDQYQWFDGVTGIYSETSDSVQIREMYILPCKDYPDGYYYIHTTSGILAEGDLPDGFCIHSALFDESPSNPRAYSVIKTAKPYQIEVNRCSAAVITESIVLGHSTVIYQAGSKLTTASLGNGLKGLQYAGAKPDVIPGRSGDQYIEYMYQQIREMYEVCNVPLINEDKQKTASNNDAQAMLFRSMKDKLRFSLYAEKIEKLIIEVMEYSLNVLRSRLPDEVAIPVIGKTEAVNIAEFRNTSNQLYQIQIKERTDDFTSVMGKSLQLSQVMQYMGSSLSPEQMVQVVRQLPFLNAEPMLKDMTINQDQADAMILALDRGEDPFFYEQTDHSYMISRLIGRMNETDFPLLNPEVQYRYQERLDMHSNFEAQKSREAQMATSGYIPTSGGLVKADYYITTAEGKQERVTLPTDAVGWLYDKLQSQGMNLEKIQELPQAGQAEIGQANQQTMGPMPLPTAL